jgi:hypothetical protein
MARSDVQRLRQGITITHSDHFEQLKSHCVGMFCVYESEGVISIRSRDMVTPAKGSNTLRGSMEMARVK